MIEFQCYASLASKCLLTPLLGEILSLALTSHESNSVNIGSTAWSREVSKIWGHEKGKKLKTTRE